MLAVTAIGAHPDDIEIFMYGFLAACRDRGDKVDLVVATDGAAGGPGPGQALARKRAGETGKALRKLGKPAMLGLPDGRLAEAEGAAAAIRGAVAAAAPDLVLTHAPEDYHPDHRALSAMVSGAASFRCPVLFADTLMGVGFEPEFYVDITAHAEEKHAAIMEHGSQQPERFARAAAIMNRYRAAQCNAPDDHRAEAWRTDRRFPFADVRAMLPAAPPHRPFRTSSAKGLI